MNQQQDGRARRSPVRDPRWKQRLRRRLLSWFDRHARDLPWRRCRTLYRVWVSEIMLQQTQVATVAGYYDRFLARFPDIASLAEADIQDVLQYWEGLGYYRRARQLHEAARLVVERHRGEFPTDIGDVCALPGIGRYTAGAILSIALDQRHPVVEANTLRLYCRLLALTEDPHRADSRQLLWAFAESLLPRRRIGDFNQALMELGGLVCKPREPDCDHCPLRPLCPTSAAGLQDRIPRARHKPKPLHRQEAAVVVRRGDHVLLRRCQDGERWAGLWDFPRFAVTATGTAPLQQELVAHVARTTGLKVTIIRQLATLKHAVTRYRITLTCHEARCRARRLAHEHLIWVTVPQLDAYPLSTTGRKLCRLLQE